MKTIRGFALIAVSALFIGTATLRAHHSDAVYDMTKMVILKATVTEHQFINPHQIIKVKVKESGGRITPWVLVGAAVSANRAAGWTKETLKAGDEITVYGFPYRDGKPNMTWMRIITSDGKMLGISGAKNDKLARYLATYGKTQLSPEDYEVFKKSLTFVGQSGSDY